MDFLKKNGFPANNDLLIERIDQVKDNFSFFIRTKEQMLIGCGIYDPAIDVEEDYQFKERIPLDQMNLDELRKNEGFVFIIGDDYFSSCPVNLYDWTPKKSNDFVEFRKAIEMVFTEQERKREEEKSYKEWKEERLAEEDPFMYHLNKVIEGLERKVVLTEKDGWNYLEIEKQEIQSDIKTLKEWRVQGFDGHRAAIFKNMCYKYDFKWIE